MSLAGPLLIGYGGYRSIDFGAKVLGASARVGLTGLRALEGCTSHAALAAGETSVAGRIAEGFRADLTALGVDPVDADADEVAEAPVRLTVTGGHVVHCEV